MGGVMLEDIFYNKVAPHFIKYLPQNALLIMSGSSEHRSKRIEDLWKSTKNINTFINTSIVIKHSIKDENGWKNGFWVRVSRSKRTKGGKTYQLTNESFKYFKCLSKFILPLQGELANRFKETIKSQYIKWITLFRKIIIPFYQKDIHINLMKIGYR